MFPLIIIGAIIYCAIDQYVIEPYQYRKFQKNLKDAKNLHIPRINKTKLNRI